MAKRYNPNKCKIHRSYTVGEVAVLYSVHKRTVRNWIKSGLFTYREKRPNLILGTDLRMFINNQRKGYKNECEQSEIYCFKCRTPQKPNVKTVEFIKHSNGIGRLFARCNKCDSKMNKYFSLRLINAIRNDLLVETTEANKGHNCDWEGSPKLHLELGDRS